MLNLYIWSNYIAPETIKKFEARHGVRVNVDLYDSNEALLAKMQAGNAGYDVICPSDYAVAGAARPGPAAAARPLGAAAPRQHRPARSSTGRYDPGNRHSVPYFWGTTGHRLRRAARDGPVDSWGALWDPRYAGGS